MKRVLTNKQATEKLEREYRKAKIRELLGVGTKSDTAKVKRTLDFVKGSHNRIERREFNAHG